MGRKKKFLASLLTVSLLASMGTAGLSASAKTVLIGDVNGDGKLTTDDVSIIKLIADGLYDSNEYTAYAGDVNADGTVDNMDASLLQYYLAILVRNFVDNLGKVVYPTIVGDVNGDGKVTNKDALEILRYTVKMSKNEKIGTEVEV